MKGKILIVEDDETIAMALQDRLASEGYISAISSDGLEGYDQSIHGDWDLIILDIMLPGKDGLEICRDLRAKRVDTPILMLTARGDTVDKVVGLKMGADDYLAKPFEMIEFLARAEALMRRRIRTDNSDGVYSIGRYNFDYKSGRLSLGEDTIALTTYEIKLLRYLCIHRGEILDRETLLNEVWGYDTVPNTRTVDMYVASLRKKMKDSRNQELIVTIRGLGYKLVQLSSQ